MRGLGKIGATVLHHEQKTVQSAAFTAFLVPYDTVRVQIVAPGTNCYAQIHPAIAMVLMYKSQHANTGPWEDRGTKRTLKKDLTDGDTNTGTAGLLKSSPPGDYLYVGFTELVNTLNVTIGTANTNVSTLAAEYWDGENWVAVANLVDNTAVGGTQTLGTSADITWDRPVDWKASRVNPGLRNGFDLQTGIAYWMRFSWSATLDADTEVALLYPEDSNYDSSATLYLASVVSEIELEKNWVGTISLKKASSSPETIFVNFVRNRKPY